MRSLTDKQVIEIRELFNSGLYSKKQLAEMYNCSQTTIALWLPVYSEYREVKIHIKRIKPKNCVKCDLPYEGHKRCIECTAYIHTIHDECEYCLNHKIEKSIYDKKGI